MAALYWQLVIPVVLWIVSTETSGHGLFEDEVSTEEYSPYLATIMPQLAQYDIPELDDVYFTSSRDADNLDLEDDSRLEQLHRRMRRRRQLRHRYHPHHHSHHHSHHRSHSRFVERLKRQAEQLEGNSVEKAKAKLQNALRAAKALGGIEKEMGLDPNAIEQKTAHLKDDLAKEEQKYKEEELSDDIEQDKRAKLKQYSEYAKKDMKEADSILSLIVKLEAAKYIAAERAREELQKAERSQIQSAPVAPPSAVYPAPPANGPYQAPYQSSYMPQYQPQFAPSTLAQQSPFSPSSPLGPYSGSFNDQPIQRPLQYSNPMQGPIFGPRTNLLFQGSPNIAAYTENEGTVEDKNEGPKVPAIVHSSFADNQQPVNGADVHQPITGVDTHQPITGGEAHSPMTDNGSAGLAPLVGDLRPSAAKPVDSNTPNNRVITQGPETKHGILKPKPSKLQNKEAPGKLEPFAKATTTESLATQIATEGVSSTEDKKEMNNPQQTINEPKQPTLVSTFSSQSAPLTLQKPSIQTKESFAHLAPLTNSFAASPAPPHPSQAFIQQRFNSHSPNLIQNSLQTNPQPPKPLVHKPEPANVKSAFDTRPNANLQSPVSAAAPMISNYFGYQQRLQQGPAQQAFAQYQPESPYAWQPPAPEAPSYYWPQQAVQPPLSPQVPQPAYPDYSAVPSYQHPPVDPKVLKAQGKVENVKKASIAVSNLETQIGLAPGTVNNLIDNVEKNAKDEVLHYEEDMARQKSEIQSEKKLIQNDGADGSVATIQKQIEHHEKKLNDDKQKEQAAERKLNEIKQIEKILTVIEAAKYSALQRAKTRLQELDAQKDILRIRKRDLEEESGVTDLKRNRRNEINIFLHGSRNKIDASHLVERKKEYNDNYKKRIRNKLSNATHHKTLNSVTVVSPPADKLADPVVPPDSRVKKSKIHKKKHNGRSKMMMDILRKIDRVFKLDTKILAQLGKKETEKLKKELVLVEGDQGGEKKKKRSVRATSMPDLVQETLQE